MLKQKAGKRFLPWLLAIAMLFSLLPVGAFAEPPTESSGTPEVAFRCLDSEGSAEVSVGDYDSSATTETLFADTSSDVISLTADSPEDSLKEGVIEDTNVPVQFDKALVLENGDIPETQEALEEEGTEISAVIKTENDFACLPAEGGKPVNLGEDQTLVILYKEEDAASDTDAGDVAALIGAVAFGAIPLTDNGGSYPVYVYGRFMNGTTHLDNGTTILKDDKKTTIPWNDTNQYITFGRISSVSSLRDPEQCDPKAKGNDSEKSAAIKAASTSAMNSYTERTNPFAITDVSNWDLHISPGATDYPNENSKKNGHGPKPDNQESTKKTWHLDGDIHVYRIAYDANADGDNVAGMPKNDGKYYFGSYTVRTEKPSREGYTFKGWTLDGETVGTEIENLKAVGGTNATITLKAMWEKEKPIETTYPIYVYGYLVNGSGYAGASLGKGAKIIKDNGDAKTFSSNGYANYITFGKIDNATTENPTNGKTTTISNTDAAWNEKLSVITANTDFQNNGFTWRDVSTWLLKPADGATDYNISTAVKTWHLDGKINVYKIKYLNDVNGNDISTKCDVTSNAYYYGSYNVSKYTPSREGYTFEGWDVNGKTYKAGDTLTLADFGDDETITLTAKWEKNKVFNVTYDWGNDAPSNVEIPTGGTYSSEANARAAMDTTFTNATTSTAQKDGKNGLWKFSGWTETTTTSDDEVTIALKGSWTFTARKYQVVYSWTNAPERLTVPVDSEEYSSKDDIIKDTIYANGYKHTTSDGIYTFSGWDDGSERTNDEGTLTTITFTGSWTFASKQYKVVYNWNSDNGVPGDVTLPTDNNSYASETEAKAAVDTNFTSASTSTAQKDGKDGLWKFSGWTASESRDSTEEENTAIITFTGTWSFNANEEPAKTLKLTFMVKGGTWNDTTSAPIVLPECVPGKDGYCSMPNGTAVPTGMLADENHIKDSGKWYRLDGEDEVLVENIQAEKFNVDTTYIFIFAAKPEIQPDKITDTLNKLIQKSFESRYGYSTEGTFTAKAKVMLDLPIPQLADAAYTPEEIGTYNGTVTLKTGETKAFSFVAADANQPDTLKANTTYVVEVTEDNTNLSNVDYDKTEYTLTIRTNENGVATEIAITPNNGETKEAENGKITFHNIYTYKRHSSNNDKPSTPNTPPTVEIPDDDALGLNDTDHFAYIVGYGNGEVRPQNSITRAEVAAIFFRLLEDDVRDESYTRQNKFTDVSDDAWYCSAVSTLSAMGIISGYPDATFRPNAPITRAEFAAIATRFDVDGDKTPVSFSDIAGHWAKDEIAVAANNGWVNGYEDGSFRPQNNITRAETMSLVNRVLNRRPETAEDLLSNMIKWTDNADTNAWYYLAVQEATNSHYYEFKENSQYEKWTELRETRDWSELDK